MVKVAVGKSWNRWWMRAERGEGGDVDGGVGMVGVGKLGL